MINVREYLKDLAIAAEGLSAAPASLPLYLDLLATNPEDRADAQTCRELAVMSSCALAVRGLWFRAGVRHPVLLARYRTGHAVADIVEIATEAHALRRLDKGYVLAPADVLVLDGPEHVLTTIVPFDGSIDSIDGGQRDAGGFEAILRKTRPRSGLTLGGRKIAFVIDADAIGDRWQLAAAAEAARIEPAPPTSRSRV